MKRPNKWLPIFLATICSACAARGPKPLAAPPVEPGSQPASAPSDDPHFTIVDAEHPPPPVLGLWISDPDARVLATRRKQHAKDQEARITACEGENQRLMSRQHTDQEQIAADHDWWSENKFFVGLGAGGVVATAIVIGIFKALGK